MQPCQGPFFHFSGSISLHAPIRFSPPFFLLAAVRTLCVVGFFLLEPSLQPADHVQIE